MAGEKEQQVYLDAEFSSGAPTPLKNQSLEELDVIPYDDLSDAEKKAERWFVSTRARTGQRAQAAADGSSGSSISSSALLVSSVTSSSTSTRSTL